MLFLNETKFASFCGENGRTLTNAFIYVLSKSLDLEETGDTLVGNEKLLTLRPSDELLKKYANNECSKSGFRKAYIEELSTQENRFILYTIVRSFNEKKYLPVFVCSDEDWELGFMKILAKYFVKKFGMKAVDRKAYQKEIKSLWKDAKRGNKKNKAARKDFKRIIRSYIKDQVQLSFEGLERLEKMEKEFSIYRMVILLNQSGDEAGEIKKKKIVEAIELFGTYKKKSKKIIKRCVDELGVSKKSDRWSRKDAINMVIKIYNTLNPDTSKS